MDPVNSAASIIALAQLTATLASTVRDLYQSLRDAPSELEAVANQVRLVHTEVTLLDKIPRIVARRILAKDISQVLEGGLEAAILNVKAIRQILERFHFNHKWKGRLKWALLERSTANKVLDRLKATESSLAIIMHTLSLCQQLAILSAIQDQKSTKILLPEPNYDSQPLAIHRSNHALKVSNHSAGQMTLSRMRSSYLGLLGSLVRAQWSSYTHWSIAVQILLPLASVFGHYIISAQVSFRTFPFCRTLSFNGTGGVALSRIIDVNHPAVLACKAGEVNVVRRMIFEGEVHPTDSTQANCGLMTYAIASGSLELVQLLVRTGAGVNWTFGASQTSPLQWALHRLQLDIVRFLLQSNADTDHISGFGRNAVMFCWSAFGRGQPSMVEYIKLLADDLFLNLGLVDKDGWTCLHRVASFGNADEVQLLLQLGADPMATSMPLKWNALQHAIFYGNEATYNVLLAGFEALIANMRDENGWTLLHLAAAAGNRFMIRDLIDRGASTQARSVATISEHLADSLLLKCCTPRDVASNEGPDHLITYDRILQDLSQLESRSSDTELQEADEVFWEAQEHLALDLENSKPCH